jgi:hypothetical protein
LHIKWAIHRDLMQMKSRGTNLDTTQRLPPGGVSSPYTHIKEEVWMLTWGKDRPGTR